MLTNKPRRELQPADKSDMFHLREKIDSFLKFNRRAGRKGIAIYIAAAVLTIVLAVALGVSLISTYQLKSLNEAGASVIAFAASESGIEWSLTPWFSGDYIDTTNYQSACPPDGGKYICAKDVALGGAKYTVEASLCGPANELLCVKSVGAYHGTQRAIRIQM